MPFWHLSSMKVDKAINSMYDQVIYMNHQDIYILTYSPVAGLAPLTSIRILKTNRQRRDSGDGIQTAHFIRNAAPIAPSIVHLYV